MKNNPVVNEAVKAVDETVSRVDRIGGAILSATHHEVRSAGCVTQRPSKPLDIDGDLMRWGDDGGQNLD